MRWPILAGFLLLLACRPALADDAPPEEGPALAFDEACDACEADRAHFRVDYLYWYLRRLHIPPVLTAGPTGSDASLDEPGTVVLRGGRITSRHDRYIGIRARADRWLGEECAVGIEVDVFFLERDSTHFTVRPGNVPVLAIPFTDAVSGESRSYVVSGFNPEFGDVLGGTRVYSRMELFGQEGNVLFNLARSPSREWNLFAGARFLQLRERLDLTSSGKVLPEQSTVLGLEDHFQTFDKFYGGQAGLAGTLRRGRWSLEGRAAVALGANEQVIRNKGERIVHTPQQRLSEPVGLFIGPGNRGEFRRTSFDVVTEVRLNLGFDVTDHLRLWTGYSLLTWDGPVRPGEQIRPIHPATPERPSFEEEFFYAQGMNVGVELRW